MSEKIVVGRDREDLQAYGDKGTAFIGKHIVGKGEEAHLTTSIYVDVARPHIILVVGKRGCGKSYTAGIFAEEITKLPEDIRQNLSVIMVDTMGIYWSMRRPNEKDRDLLREWGLKPQGLEVQFFVPKGYVEEYEKAGLEYDNTLSLPCGELTAADWCITFGFSQIEPHGIAIDRAVKAARKAHGDAYGIEEIMKAIDDDKRTEQQVKDAVAGRFSAAMEWGLFEKKGTPIAKLMQPGVISVVDTSHYASVSSGWSVRNLIVGLICRKVYQERVISRKIEEMETITGEKRQKAPMVWLMVDEAHQFLPAEGMTPSTEPLLTIVKQGREPGISLLLITQRPNKLHEDALAQADLVISNRLTARADLDALRAIMQNYVLEDIEELINNMPRQKGAAIVLDDNSERLFAIQIRPRLSWHAGGSPSAIKRKGLLEE
ncbi:MAG: ATP-binding protein [Candidatus Aenigmarchaeota archaeon]|nr:ATP-binding protein [Candidatus Aenigmarchaeota archaeon]